ncbi:hypothetical protein V2J09_009660 [Rumex salicifolius]
MNRLKLSPSKHSIFLLLLLIGFSLLFSSSSSSLFSSSYVRPGARDTLLTPHKRSKHEPQQVHVSLVGEDHMKVSWVTENSTAPSTVEYGKQSGKYVASSTGDHLTYDYFLYTSDKIHHVTIGPLDPSTTYYYRCSQAGPEYSFRTPPSSLPINFVVVGDLGQTRWTKSTLEHIGEKDYDVFLLPGDLSYADMLQPLWDSFGRLVEPYASSRPWMVTEGNHDVEIIPMLHSEGFIAYNARWPMPYKESNSPSNHFYSFEVAGGSVHVIMLGSYAEHHADSDQYRWLKDDLAGVDRGRTPWVFVVNHAPWYNSNHAHNGEGEEMRKGLEELLYEARVDAVFSGHVHAYERFTRVYDNAADPCGPVYITIGDGGNREGLAMSYVNPAPLISEFREASFGHGRLNVINATTAHWSWHRNHDSTDTPLADEIWLDSLSFSKKCWPNLQSKDEL